MGCNVSLLKSIKGGSEEAKDKKILFVGLDNAGKSTVLFQMKQNSFKDTVPTVGLNVEQVKFRNNITLTLWDVGGNARKLWKHYYDKIDSLVFVVDCSDDKRLELAKSEMLKVISDPELDACPMLIFANKQDMDGSISGQELANYFKIKSLTKKAIIIQECSGKTGQGVWLGITKMGQMIEVIEKNQDITDAVLKGINGITDPWLPPQENHGLPPASDINLKKETPKTQPKTNKSIPQGIPAKSEDKIDMPELPQPHKQEEKEQKNIIEEKEKQEVKVQEVEKEIKQESEEKPQKQSQEKNVDSPKENSFEKSVEMPVLPEQNNDQVINDKIPEQQSSEEPVEKEKEE